MDCVNHSGINATAYCQSCGKPLCVDCVAAGVLRHGSGGQILCDACINAWQSYQQPFIPPPVSGPNPSSAAVLGLIPGVGAMYNGQFLKGFIHVVVFAVLVSITDYYPIFGIFIAAWIVYQSFDAYHTAKALRDGQPPPDPFGLNEVGNWLNLGTRLRNPVPPAAGQAPVVPPTAGYQPPPPYQAPYTPPVTGYIDPATPPPPPICWRRREPVGAIVLIALGLLFLLGQLDVFRDRFFGLTWPLLLIALGVWLIIRRIEDSRGGSK
jgi:Domain of unknown function (DUF5668)/B-box zinc finger